MLQAIRSRATSFVVKILFGVLIVTFGLWGIGDIFRNRDTDTSVAKVGGISITTEQLNASVQQDMNQLRGSFGSITLEQAKQLGVVDIALNRLIDSDLIELEVRRQSLAVGDTAVRNAIIANQNFRGVAGSFDRNVYSQVLAANRMSEAQYESLQRSDLVRGELTISLTEGMTPPQALTEALYRTQAERRIADTVNLPASAAGPAPIPTDSDLAAFYAAHQDRFHTPERRDFTLGLLRISDVAAGIAVPDDRLQEEYKARLQEFHKPEERQLQQMLLADADKAKAAASQLASGKNFADVAKAMTGADPASLDLGWVKRDDLPPALADAAFALKQDGVSAPVQTSFGWHIVKLVGIHAETTQSFAQVKAQLQQDVARDEAGDQIAKTANQVDDALAGGASIADVASKFGLKTVSVAGIDIAGHDAGGKSVDLPKPQDTIMRTAFSTDGGQTSQLADLGDDGYFVAHVDKVQPTGVRPLTEAHDDVVKLWQADQRNQALSKLAAAIVAEVNSGRSLRDVAASRKLAVTTTAALPRTGDSKTAPAVVAALFGVKPGQATFAPSTDGFVVAQLMQIQPADPAKDKPGVDALSHQLNQQMQSELLAEFDQALRRRFPVEINQTNLGRAL
ncbi:MAG TPA: peptidyl-prolyl cis-trans isomerase [Stellaceae bacterium]|jgi:peptidyl-prolyl cis-trans isomerase D|nr:peptidyl-prolyl cis-trans isomerase [Stellaceae bacterium]